MTGEQRRCPKCGADLPANAPKGLCPQCLMKAGMEVGSEDTRDGPSEASQSIPTSATPSRGFIPPEPKELAEKLPQFEIIELLGQGGMGAVYRARQRQLDRMVALKILPPDVSQTETFAERFTREARSLAKLNHPQIVTVHDFGHTEDGLYYFAMEYVDGTDLRHVMQAGELTSEQALTIVPQICEALHYAHKKGIVHRDIKPENILLDKEGNVKIADFGLARLLDMPATDYTLTHAGHRMGTPHYMAPEQIEHPHNVDHRADIYSLGVVFYEMLTGELPLGRFAPPSKKVRVDVRLDEIVLHTLEKEPELRYQQASEVKTDVETVRNQGQPELSSAKKSESARPFGVTFGEHLRLVAILRIVWGCFGLLVGVALIAILVGPVVVIADPEPTRIVLGFALPLAGFIWLLSIPDVIAGIGLLKRRNWARILAIILGILDLLAIPVGTAIGIYTIWILTRKEIVDLICGHVSEKEGSASDRDSGTQEDE